MFVEVNGVGGAPLILIFLAAMSSSRSDVVTQSVRSFVFPFVRPSPFFSFIVLEVSSCSKECQCCFNAV